MIIRINRGSIMVSLHEKTITIAGEMFFPPNDKIGFLLYSASLKQWDHPHQDIALTADDIARIIADIRQGFESGGHTLEVV